MTAFLAIRVEDLLRSVVLLLSLFWFLGWGFSGTVGLVGSAMLIVVCATLVVALTPDSALGESIPRFLYVVMTLSGAAGALFWAWHTWLNSSSTSVWQSIVVGCVTAFGLIAGLARLRRAADSHGTTGEG